MTHVMLYAYHHSWCFHKRFIVNYREVDAHVKQTFLFQWDRSLVEILDTTNIISLISIDYFDFFSISSTSLRQSSMNLTKNYLNSFKILQYCWLYMYTYIFTFLLLDFQNSLQIH